MDHRPDCGLWSLSVLTICSLDWLRSGPVMVFFRFRNQTSKHYSPQYEFIVRAYNTTSVPHRFAMINVNTSKIEIKGQAVTLIKFGISPKTFGQYFTVLHWFQLELVRTEWIPISFKLDPNF